MINKVTINKKEYIVDDGVALSDKATEELDTITFSISNVEEIELEPFQNVEVELANGNILYFLVNTWVDEVASFYGLKNYTINCISQTKKLERVVLPNMTITQPLGLADSEKRKYTKYINQLMPKVKEVYPELNVQPNLTQLLYNEIAVEEQFNTPTAKEYFNSILGKLGKVVQVKNDYITYFDLTQKKNEIDESKILFTNKSQNIEEYHSSIRTDLQGVQSDTPTIINELVGVRSPDNAVVTYDNAVIKLSHNIDKIIKVRVIAMIHYGGNQNRDAIAIFTIQGESNLLDSNDNRIVYNQIVEKTIYDTLKVSNKVSSDFSDDELKRMHLYYTRGSNTIEGLGYTEKTWFAGLSSVFTAIENIIIKAGKDATAGTETIVSFPNDFDIRDLKFEITYSAIDDVSTKFDKPNNYESQVRDNQVDAYVDLDKFARVEQEKLNRLGNEVLEINARYYSLAEVPALMDYIDDYILAEREIVYHRDYIDFKGRLYKNYVKKNFFYGVNAKKRSSQLLMGNNAVTRKEITKETYSFDFENKGGDMRFQRYLLGKIQASDWYAESLYNMKYDTIKIATCRTTFADGGYIDYRLEPDIRIGGNNIFINFKWYDNINVGMRLDGIKDKSIIETLTNSKGGYGQEYVSYTDENGELDKIQIKLYDYYYLDLAEESTYDEYDNFPLYDSSRINEDYCIYDVTLQRHKDNREILNETLQFEIKTSEGIFYNKRFLEDTAFYGWKTIREFFYIYVSEEEYYDEFNCDKVLGTAIQVNSSQLSIDFNDYLEFYKNKVLNNSIKVYNKNEEFDFSNVKSWAVADSFGNVYFAVNKRPTDDVIRTIIYLNKED